VTHDKHFYQSTCFKQVFERWCRSLDLFFGGAQIFQIQSGNKPPISAAIFQTDTTKYDVRQFKKTHQQVRQNDRAGLQ
jgi:hypothetical protein